MRYQVEIGDWQWLVGVTPDSLEAGSSSSRQFRLTRDAESWTARLLDPGPPCLVTIDGQVFEIELHRMTDRVLASSGEATAVVRSEQQLAYNTSQHAAAGGSMQVKSPIPGRVVRYLVAEGDEVQAGQAVVVVEAMKMENELFAPAAGRVSDISVSPGQAVDAATALLVIIP